MFHFHGEHVFVAGRLGRVEEIAGISLTGPRDFSAAWVATRRA